MKQETDLQTSFDKTSWANHVVFWWGGLLAFTKGSFDRKFLPAGVLLKNIIFLVRKTIKRAFGQNNQDDGSVIFGLLTYSLCNKQLVTKNRAFRCMEFNPAEINLMGLSKV
jgi:hypothetical protein